MAKRGKGRSKRFPRDNPDDPLGVGLSKRTLTMIGLGVVGAVLLKMWLDRRKAQSAGAAPTPPALNGVGSSGPVGVVSPPAPPPPTPSAGQMPQSSRAVNDGPRSMNAPSRFSGLGDGELNGRNGSL